MRLGALIMTGGASSRMSADKAALMWGGRRAVDRVADLAREAGAGTVLTVGRTDYGLPAVTDEPADGGPVAGIAAGAARLRSLGCGRILILAVDAPTASADDLGPLLAAPAPGAAYEGLHFPMVVDLAAIPAQAGANWAMGRLAEAAGVRRLACPSPVRSRLRGANTPQEREALLAELAGREGAQEPGAD